MWFVHTVYFPLETLSQQWTVLKCQSNAGDQCTMVDGRPN